MSLQPGTTILNGEFKILAEVKHGAFGVVYRALDVNLNIERAIKIIRRDEDGMGSAEFKDFRNRFRQEAQLGAKLEGRNAQHVVRTYALREDEGELYLIMEFMSGGSLADRLKNGALPLDECLRIAKDVAAGLAEIHALDVVHRDLKPSNILFDGQGTAKMADLGLAQIPGGMSQRSALGSAASAHPGTPAYMSPEQRETTDYLTPASDVYTFGLVLFEMLTGRHYKNVAPDEVFNAFKPQPLQKMQGLLKRCLEENPSERPFNGDKLLAELGAPQNISAESLSAKIESPNKRSAQTKKAFFFGALFCFLGVIVILALRFPPQFPQIASVTPSALISSTLSAQFTPTSQPTQTAPPTPRATETVIPTITPSPLPKPTETVIPTAQPTPTRDISGWFFSPHPSVSLLNIRSERLTFNTYANGMAIWFSGSNDTYILINGNVVSSKSGFVESIVTQDATIRNSLGTKTSSLTYTACAGHTVVGSTTTAYITTPNSRVLSWAVQQGVFTEWGYINGVKVVGC